MVTMATHIAILTDVGDVHTNSKLILIIYYHIEGKTCAFHLIAGAANYLICIFMNINENLNNKGKIVKKHHKYLISNPNHHQTTIVAFFFISPVIQFDKYFHLMFLYGNYLICIFINITGNLKRQDKTIA